MSKTTTASDHAIRPVDPGPSDAVVSEVALAIGEMQRAAGLCFAVNVGRLVLERFFGGDMALLRSHGKKSVSLGRLAEHPALPMNKCALFRAIAIFEVVDRMGGVATWKHLCASHVRAVLPLAPVKQRKLLKTAEAKGWTVRTLEEKVAKLPRTQRPGGRPQLPAFVKTIRGLRKYQDAPEVHFEGINGGSDLSRTEARELYQIVSGLRAQLEKVERGLHELGRRGIDDDEDDVPS